MQWLFVVLCMAGRVTAEPLDGFVASAGANHGSLGERAARFLVENMPPQDRETLSSEYLRENLDLAFRAREEYPWAAQVPEEIFLNDVLPYAVFDEPRDPWRAELHIRVRELVKDSHTATEAAQALNRQVFNLLNVHYNTGRKRPNQSLHESVELGKATCTGLAIILVEACRTVGVPARAVGTPLWANKRGNHTWVEIWDDGWHFTGADEYDAAGVDRGWFTGDAAQAKADVVQNAIYATSWKRNGLTFPMVWARHSESVAAVNVTARYAASPAEGSPMTQLGVRLWDRRGGTRLAATVSVLEGGERICAVAETKAGRTDLNDLARFDLNPGAQGRLRFTLGDASRELAFGPLAPGNPTVDAVWSELQPTSAAIDALQEWVHLPVDERPANASVLRVPLTRDESERAQDILVGDRMSRLAKERAEELESRAIVQGDKTMRWLEKTFGEAPAGGHSLWISMHGGGNTRPEVNDRQWQNQSRLYELTEGIYVAPRSPTDTWNLWHESHIDPMFQHLIETYVALRGVNPNRIYLMGYSAGGDGVWQLAPRMADRFAAAAMMAGHPNEASLLGLRDLPFAMFVGGNDSAYHRNEVVAERATELDRLEKDDAGGYIHMSRVYEGLGHWMNGKDAEAIPWMARFERDPWPKKIVWQQDDVVHRRFYWLRIPEDTAVKGRQTIIAEVKGQSIELNGEVPARLWLRLSDRLLDLDAPITVTVNGQVTFAGKIQRDAAALVSSLAERADPPAAASAYLCLEDCCPAAIPSETSSRNSSQTSADRP